MAELPITYCNLKHGPYNPGGRDGYRWHVGLEEDVLLVVDLSHSQAIETGLGASGLRERLEPALQRYARGRLRNDMPVLDQVIGWNSPVVLRAEHFS